MSRISSRSRSSRWRGSWHGSTCVRRRDSIARRGTSSSNAKEHDAEIMTIALAMFVGFVAITLVITWWAARRSHGAAAFFTASRRITAWQNGVAVAGDYMSAASFLGIAGLIAFNGYDGFMYSVGWLVAYLTVLLIIAEPLRNTGKFTMADVLAFRLRKKSVRTVAAISTLIVTLVYMLAQMIGAGSLIHLLIPQINLNLAIISVGLLMVIYVIFGGMLATTWVQ